MLPLASATAAGGGSTYPATANGSDEACDAVAININAACAAITIHSSASDVSASNISRTTRPATIPASAILAISVAAAALS